MPKLFFIFLTFFTLLSCKSFKPGYYCNYNAKTTSIVGFNFDDNYEFYTFLRREGSKVRKINSGKWKLKGSKIFYFIDTTYNLNGVAKKNAQRDTFYLKFSKIKKGVITTRLKEKGRTFKVQYIFCNNNPSLN